MPRFLKWVGLSPRDVAIEHSRIETVRLSDRPFRDVAAVGSAPDRVEMAWDDQESAAACERQC